MSPHFRPLAGFKNMADPQLVTTASAGRHGTSLNEVRRIFRNDSGRPASLRPKIWPDTDAGQTSSP